MTGLKKIKFAPGTEHVISGTVSSKPEFMTDEYGEEFLSVQVGGFPPVRCYYDDIKFVYVIKEIGEPISFHAVATNDSMAITEIIPRYK